MVFCFFGMHHPFTKNYFWRATSWGGSSWSVMFWLWNKSRGPVFWLQNVGSETMSTALRATPKSWPVHEIATVFIFSTLDIFPASPWRILSLKISSGHSDEIWQSARRVSGSTRTCFFCFCFGWLSDMGFSFFYPTKICNPFRSCPLTMVQTLFSNCHTLFSSIVRVTVFSFNFLVDTSVDKWIPSARVRWSNFVEMAGCVYQILTLRAGMKPLQMG